MRGETTAFPTIEQFPDLAREKLSEFLAQRRPEVAEIGEPVVNATNFQSPSFSMAASAFAPPTRGLASLGAHGLRAARMPRLWPPPPHRWSSSRRARLSTMTSSIPLIPGAEIPLCIAPSQHNTGPRATTAMPTSSVNQ